MITRYLIETLLVAAMVTLAIRWSATLLAGRRISHLVDGRIKEEVFSRKFPLVILFCLVFKEVVPWEVPQENQLSVVKLASVSAVICLHFWKRNLFLSVIGGTLFFVCARFLIV